MAEPALTNVFVFTAKREEVARYFEEVLGVRRQPPRDDSIWFESSGGATVPVHDREDEPADGGFIPWFQVPDLAEAYERADALRSVVGTMREGYFFARDPGGRVFGVRQWR
jgi:hypothetical protein